VCELGFHFFTARRYDEAVPVFQSALKLEPDLLSAHLGLAWVYDKMKMYSDAIAEAKQAVNLSNENEVALATLGRVLADSGQKVKARKLLEQMQLSSAHRYVSPYLIADMQSAVGEVEKAIRSLERL